MGIIFLSLLLCACNAGMWWLALWRFLAGVGGGILMALAGPAAVAAAPAAQRGAVGGIVIAGVGLGIAGGALVVPVLLIGGGIKGGWIGLSILVGALWFLARRHWPTSSPTNISRDTSATGRAVLVTYSLHSAGMVPPMIYLADLAVRGHHLDIEVGSLIWFAFGLAGVVGGVFAGKLTDHLDNRKVLIALLTIQATALALILIAAALAGLAAVGTTAVVLSLAQDIAGSQATLLWVRCTAAFSIVQAAVAFVLAALFAATNESHIAIFGAGLAFSVMAIASTRWI
jgi:predicted MFS family arabinose efflux permease